MKKYFTLIELIVVIVVIGILTAIVIPNVSNLQDESRTAAIESNGKNIQTAVDTYHLTYNGDFPTLQGEEPKLGHSKQLDFSKLDPEYLRKSPQLGLYWLDHNGAVIYSDTDMPNGFVKEGNKLSWKEPAIGQASSYKVYGTNIPIEGSAKKPLITFIKEVDSTDYLLSGEEANYEGYLVSTISVKGFESPAIGAGISYEGYIPVSPDSSTGIENGEDTGSGGDKGESIAKITPTTVGTRMDFSTLSSTVNPEKINILQNGENVEVFYNPMNCCIQNNLYKEVFNPEGEQVSRNLIQNYSGQRVRDISNLDEAGNRYLFDDDSKLYIVKPDNSAELVADIKPTIDPYNRSIAKPGIALEANLLYITYHKEKKTPYLLIFDLEKKEVLSNNIGWNATFPGYDIANVLITEDYIYTSALMGYIDSDSATYVLQWDKKTGKYLKFTVPQIEDQDYSRPVLFADTNEGIWVSQSRFFQNRAPIKLFKLSTTPLLVGTEKELDLPDTTMPRVDAAITQKDGSIHLIGVQGNNKLSKSIFK